MAKIVLTNITNIGGNPNAAQLAINENFAAIAAAFEKCLFRDGTSPNQMEADLDLNGHVLDNGVLGPEMVIDDQDEPT